MADTAFATGSAHTVKLWRKELFREVLKRLWFARFIGSGSDSMIQAMSDLKKDQGDRIRVQLRTRLVAAGVQGDATLEGNEEALSLYYDDLVINQIRHAVVSGGKMTEQRVTFDIRNEAMMGLADWWKERIETSLANQLTGNAAQTNTLYTGNNATSAPTTDRFLVANGETAEASLSTSTVHYFSLALLDRAVARAKANTVPIRPIMVDGGEYYAAFLHPYQVYQMRTSTNTGQWLDIQKSAMAGQQSSENPIFKGALGIYNGVVLHECPYLPAFTLGASGTDNARRAVFAGAQAAVWARGGGGRDTEMSWEEETFDYGNKLGVEAGMIFGCKKTVFNSQDFGVITMASYSPQP